MESVSNQDCLHLVADVSPFQYKENFGYIMDKHNQIQIEMSIAMEAGQYLKETNVRYFLL